MTSILSSSQNNSSKVFLRTLHMSILTLSQVLRVFKKRIEWHFLYLTS